MMNSSATLAELIQRGVQFRVSGEQLAIRAPKDSLGLTEREMLSRHKAEILAILSDRSDTSMAFYPLSHGQMALWFLHQLAPQSSAYNLTTAMHVTSQIDVQALRRALDLMMVRHPCLRTTYPTINAIPVQRVHESMRVHFAERDVSSLSQEEVNGYIAEEADRPFDLEQGPVMRVNLLTRSGAEHILQLTVHHIAYDFWSAEIFIQELREVYRLETNGAKGSLPCLPVQYPDWVRWQSEMLASQKGKDLWEYWNKQLAGESPILSLPTDRPRPPVQTFGGSSHSFSLRDSLTQKLKAIAKAEGATLYMTLVAAFFVLLHRYSAQECILIGSPTAGRSRTEFEGIVGFFVNPVVLRADLSGNPTFKAFLGQVRQTVLGALNHADYPFPLLVKRLQPNRDLTHSPLFQVSFVWDRLRFRDKHAVSASGRKATPSETNEKGLALEPIVAGQRGADCDLDLIILEGENSLSASWRYNVDLFDVASIARMTDHFQVLLEGIVANPEQRLSEFSLLTEGERQQLLVSWNNTKTDYARDRCVHELFEAQAQQKPDFPAATYDGTQITYQKLNERANRIAHYLRRKGVGPETLVGIYMERSLDIITTVLGVLKAGGAYLPLDPTYPRERLAFMLEDSHARMVLTHRSLAEGLPANKVQVVNLETDQMIINQEDKANPVCVTSPESLLYVIYTSGSTGQAKGVMIKHSSLTNAYFAWEEAYQLLSLRSHLQMASFSFDVFSGDFVRALCSGGKLVLCPRDFLMEPERLYSLMQKEQIDCAEFVPVVLRELIDYLEANQKRLDVMRVLICGSDSWYMKEYNRFTRLFGPQTRVINSYGVTEATIDSSYFESVDMESPPDQLVPIGRPFANVQLYVLDRNLEPTPIGVPGELHIGGAGLARGYLNRPELTAEKFIPNPFADKLEERLYKTGDLARYLPDGNIELLGRMDFQVKIRGFRIEIGEIESVLGQHPAVRQNCVKAIEEEPGTRRIVAYVALKHPSKPSVSDLRSFLKEKLPDYMLPSAFVFMEEFPLMPNGKVDRNALPKPETEHISDQGYVAPRSETENKVAAIWQEVLKQEKVGVHHDFFGMGGHSLLATRVMSRINQLFGIQLPLRKFFEVTTIATLAALIDTLLWTSGQAVGPLQTEERDIIEL
jgi:amino acid adenylation domain-containing protein